MLVLTKNISVITVAAVLLAGCQLLPSSRTQTTQQLEVEQTIPEQSALPSLAPQIDGEVLPILITEKNFSTTEIYASQGKKFSLVVRNQLTEPIAVVIDDLRVNSGPIAMGEQKIVEIPTSRSGEFEMYSNLGSQKAQGFQATVYIEE